MDNIKQSRKKSQLGVAVIFIIVTIILAFNLENSRLVMFLLFGMAFGLVLQRSRFCFTSAFRDPIILKMYTMVNYVLLSLLVGVVGVYFLQIIYSIQGKELTGLSAVTPFSPLTMIGATLFGIGMVLAGGCASGTLVRISEGTKLHFLSFIFFVLGSILGGGFTGIIEPAFSNLKVRLYLPEMFGWTGALIIQVLIIMMIYFTCKKIKNKK